MKIKDIETLTKRLGELIDMDELGLGSSVAPIYERMTLGELICKTDNLRTHKRLRNLGDKRFTLFKEGVAKTPEYKSLKIEEEG